MFKWVILFLFIISLAVQGLCSETRVLPCEVLEASKISDTSSRKLSGIRYVLLHHANSVDRQALSEWLKGHSGADVRFRVGKAEYRGTLFRLAHCFGRGLLIYAAPVSFGTRDILELLLPAQP